VVEHRGGWLEWKVCQSCVTTEVSNSTCHTRQVNKLGKVGSKQDHTRSQLISDRFLLFKSRLIQHYVINIIHKLFYLWFGITHVGGHPMFCHTCHTSQ
jgi:hypothetical protein